MFTRAKKLYRAVIDLLLLPDAVYSIDAVRHSAALSEVDRYVTTNAYFNRSVGGLFEPFYEPWNAARITKILGIYGVDFFPGKTVLEIGAGHGDIGAFFAELGADVLCVDGRIENVNYAKLKHRSVARLRCEQMDLEEDFSHLGRFDLILNMGLLYHLRSVEENLKCCLSMTDEVIVESRVCDSTDPYRLQFTNERGHVDHMGIHGVGSRPSPFFIERVAEEAGFEVIRHFAEDLNCKRAGRKALFDYTWQHKNDNRCGKGYGYRRFWRMRKIAQPPQTL